MLQEAVGATTKPDLLVNGIIMIQQKRKSKVECSKVAQPYTRSTGQVMSSVGAIIAERDYRKRAASAHRN